MARQELYKKFHVNTTKGASTMFFVSTSRGVMNSADKTEAVRSYYRKDGTYVESYYRSPGN
jgi:hypothetical protein